MSAATRGMPEHTYPAEADGSRALPIMPRPWRRFVTRAAAAPRSATVAATRWWPPSGGSIPISRRSGSTTGAPLAASTSARAASRRARSPRRAERVTDPTLARFRAVVERALAHFETRRQEINDLNVFPVADGDTGDNMALTLRAVLAELDRLSDGRGLDEIGREEIVDSVVREMAHRVATELAHMPDRRLNGHVDPDTQDSVLATTLERALEAGEQSVKRGPELLPILREAGVVDAGGYGLVVLFAGMIAALRGDEPPELDHHAPARITHPEHHSSTYRFCTNFVVTGSALDGHAFIPALETIGDSVLVVGDRVTLKVHVHTDEPDRAVRVFAGAGDVSHVDVADMREQMRERDERLEGPDEPVAACGALAVVAGAGMRALFEGLGARALGGGATLNPSTYELLAGVHTRPPQAG